jgi:CheY-like chemotaxis protein
MTRRRILIVDDERLLAETLRAMIAAESDAEVQIVTSGARAADLIATDGDFDAVICDLAMPGIDGVALYEEIRRRGSPLADRFVLMTGGTFTDATAAFLARTPIPRLDKPFESGQLHAALAELFARSSSPRSS